MNSIINQITGKDRVFGNLCYEADNTYKHSNYFAALACLFIISEQIIKHSVNQVDGNFNQVTIDAREQDIIDEIEFKLIHDLRRLKNYSKYNGQYNLYGMYIGFLAVFIVSWLGK